mmetsp:Transcript_17243/g.35518  ORF Transcript_17243/g.35518 Transcript_17243/m.35518 type:complete len:218 (+) Transcript_17243:41-694(+)
MVVNNAPIKWAQRSDAVFITITVPDLKDEKVTLSNDKLVMTASSGSDSYQCDITFFAPCVSSESTYKVLPRCIQMHLIKEEKESEFWPRLLKDKNLEKNQVSIDWNRYVDEDEEEDADDFDVDGFGGQMGGAQAGMPPGIADTVGQMGGMEELMKSMGTPGNPGEGWNTGMPPGLEGMGGMADMMSKMKKDLEKPKGGQVEDEEDSDDDDLPDLEES